MSADILQFMAVNDAPNRIRELRMAEELSQEALGNLVGVSKVTISELERGKMALTIDYMRRIAPALGVTPADLLLKGDNPTTLSAEEHRWIQQFRTATTEQREQLRGVADVIAPFRGAEEPEKRLKPPKKA